MANKNKNKSKSLPTQVEIFQGTRSDIAQSAIFRSGGGFHKDARRTKKSKTDWKRDEW